MQAANAALRKQYRLDPSVLSEEDLERAKLLLARDERKRQKKLDSTYLMPADEAAGERPSLRP